MGIGEILSASIWAVNKPRGKPDIKRPVGIAA